MRHSWIYVSIVIIGACGALYWAGPEKLDAWIKAAGPILEKIIAYAGEKSTNAPVNSCQIINSPYATCGAKDDHTVAQLVTTVDQLASRGTPAEPQTTSFPTVPPPNTPVKPGLEVAPKTQLPLRKTAHSKKMPYWFYAYAIDSVIRSEGDEGESLVLTVWIRCSEKPWSSRVAELCGETSSPEYRRTHHLRRS
jgi:hypothetical protein